MSPNDDAHDSPPADDTGVAPAPARDPEILIDHIREISQTARGTWFALLALLAFVGVTMMAHTDASFFAAGVATKLPMVGLEVPTLSFFIATPLMIAALYVHLHLFLVSLWNALADAPEQIGSDRLFDRVYPGLIAQTTVLYRSRARPDESAPPHAFAGAMKASVLLLVWLAAPALLAWLFWRSMALHRLALTL
ncbi:MAG: hypothetical protein L0H73_11020 [Nitrococcus sp.]|nr:hypothetical protein [Nitrococcus sp.]